MIRRVSGNSMAPTLGSGDIVVSARRIPLPGDIVIARQNGREVIKRVTKISDGQFYLVGDNSFESQDSRHFGSVPSSAILGVIMIYLPSAVAPPEPRTPYASKVAWALAGIMLVMVFLHLVRIDKLIPIIDTVLPGGLAWAVAFVCIVVTTEVFALPFLLGMKLSPLARICGGLCAVFAPLAWASLSVWAIGGYATTGQFSSYLNVMPTWWLLIANYLWLGVSYWVLWLLSYDKSFSRLSRHR
jgi:signal peptidase I